MWIILLINSAGWGFITLDDYFLRFKTVFALKKTNFEGFSIRFQYISTEGIRTQDLRVWSQTEGTSEKNLSPHDGKCQFVCEDPPPRQNIPFKGFKY